MEDGIKRKLDEWEKWPGMSAPAASFYQKIFDKSHTRLLTEVVFPSGESPWPLDVALMDDSESKHGVLGIYTGKAGSDTDIHQDPVHHALVVLEGTREVYVLASESVSTSGMVANSRIPEEEFKQRANADGYRRFEVNTGDAIFIQRDRRHRVFAKEGSAAAVFAVKSTTNLNRID